MKAALAETGPNPPAGHLAFLGRLGAWLGGAGGPRQPFGVAVVHLSDLQRINTTVGYAAGEHAARRFPAAVAEILRDRDWLMPLAQDRFAVVLGGVGNAGHLVLAANRFAQIAAGIVLPDGTNAGLETVTGAALYPQHGESGELLLRHCELAVESARREQRPFALYRREDTRQLTEEWDLETELAAGLGNSEFELAYQPKVDARTARPCGAEALLRWNNPHRGPVSPEKFIAVAERSELIDSLTDFTLHSAARDAAEWPAHAGPLHVAVNLSPATIERGGTLASLERVAAIWGTGIERFTAEVTENGIIATGGAALRVLQEMRDKGIRVSIDDFGTGNSSLAYFKDIPADEVKIDKSFILAMLGNEANHGLVRSIIDLAHTFGLEVVAEGVESEAQAAALRRLGCDTLQGYLFSRPLRQRQLIPWLEARMPTPGESPEPVF